MKEKNLQHKGTVYLTLSFAYWHNGCMDSNQPQSSPSTQPSAPIPDSVPLDASPEPTKTPLESSPGDTWKQKLFSNKKLLIGGGGALIILTILLGVLSASMQDKAQPQPTPTDTNTQQFQKKDTTDTGSENDKKEQNYYFVYGTWTAQTSAIRAIDLNNEKTYQIATLPLNIRKISLLNSETLLYIDQTDQRNNGRRISLYNIYDKSITTSIYADSGNTIYDYFLSADKKYLVLWEMRNISSPEEIYENGRSQIYSVDLTNASIKNTIYDETIKPTIPIHYPRGITNSGTIFTDSFIPDTTLSMPKNWGYGLSMVDVDGTNKKDIGAVSDGTYGLQPIMSPDGKYLLFAGYDGFMGDGKNSVNGTRQALKTPNVLELLNTQTQRRFPLPNVDSNIYTRISWDQVTNTVTADIQSETDKELRTILYDLESQSSQQITLPKEDDIQYTYISQLPEGKLLMGIPDTKSTSLGTLGNQPQLAYTSLAVKDTKDKITKLPVKDYFLQYITILPEDFFKSRLQEATYSIPHQ